MILPLLIFLSFAEPFAALAAEVSAGPALLRLGIVERFDLVPSKQARYIPLFTYEKGTWRSATNSDSRFEMSIFFDGRIIGTIKLPAVSCLVAKKSLPDNAQAKLQKYSLVTTTLPVTSDPEVWKPLLLKQAPFSEKEINKQLEKLPISCFGWEGPEKKLFKARKPTYSVHKVYAPKNKDRFLVLVEKDKNCMAEGGDGDLAQKVWLFFDQKGAWTSREGNELVDIGDFQGNGQTQGLFVGRSYVPRLTYELIDLKTFRPLVHSDISMYDSDACK
jgi:hypothetical protein